MKDALTALVQTYLGLALLWPVATATVARIVRRHRGRVWARGELGRGAVFGFALPELGAPASGAASETE